MAKNKISNIKPEVIEKSTTHTKSLISQSNSFFASAWIPSLVLLSLSFLLYFQCIPFGYVLDDQIVITDNSYTTQGVQGIGKLLTTESMEGYFKEQRNLVQGGRYRPLSLVTFAIEHSISPSNPHLSHIINIGLYAICCILIMWMLSFLYPIEGAWYFSLPFIIALLFLVHPIHTEAVANIKGRDEIMAALFGFLSIIFAMKYVAHHKGVGLLVLSGLMYYLGLLSKENIITFLGAIPLFFLVFHRGDAKRQWFLLFTILGITVLYLIQRTAIIGFLMNTTPDKDIMNNPFVDMSLSERLATVFHTMLVYLKLCVIPHPLTHDYYPYHISKMQWTSPTVIVSFLTYLILTVFAFIKMKSKPYYSYAWLFYFGTLLIVSNMIFNVGTFMNERFIFISSLGVLWILVMGTREFFYKVLPQIKNAWSMLLLGIAVLFSVLTFIRIPVWEDAMTLNRAAVKVSKNSARANSFMSTALYEKAKEIDDRQEKKDMLLEAEIYAKRAVEIIPNYGNANLMLAGIAAELYRYNSDTDGLLNTFAQILPRHPGNTFIPEYLAYLNDNYRNQVAQCYFQACETLRQKKQYQWAMHHLTAALKLFPSHPQLKALTAQTYRDMGDETKAQLFD